MSKSDFVRMCFGFLCGDANLCGMEDIAPSALDFRHLLVPFLNCLKSIFDIVADFNRRDGSDRVNRTDELKNRYDLLFGLYEFVLLYASLTELFWRLSVNDARKKFIVTLRLFNGVVVVGVKETYVGRFT